MVLPCIVFIEYCRVVSKAVINSERRLKEVLKEENENHYRLKLSSDIEWFLIFVAVWGGIVGGREWHNGLVEGNIISAPFSRDLNIQGLHLSNVS